MLAVIDGLPADVWGATGVVGDRGLGGILVHHLGAHMRWRLGLGGDDEAAARHARSASRCPTPDALARRWADEWDALDAWLDTLDRRLARRAGRRGARSGRCSPTW